MPHASGVRQRGREPVQYPNKRRIGRLHCMTCPFREDVPVLLDGELPDARAEEVRQHLAGCESCADFLLWCWWLDERVCAVSGGTSPAG